MKVAITYNKADNQIWQHFGKTETFRIVTIEGVNVTSDKIIDTEGAGHGALAGFLKNLGVDAVICGGIGAGAQNALAGVGIKVFGGVSGDADDAIVSFVTGNLSYNPNVVCSHHEHSEGSSCGNHGCSGSCH